MVTKINFGQIKGMIPSVMDFGAVGDSTNGVDGTDDTAAIQAAVTSGNCYFPDTGAKYRVTGNIVMPSNRLIKGPGTISVGNAGNYVPCFSLDGVTNVTFDGLNFHANQTTSNTQCAVDMTNTVLASPCTNITVRDAVFTNIQIITSYRSQGLHNTGVGTYAYSNYATAAYRHSKITVEHVRCVATDVTSGTNLSKQVTELGYIIYLFFADDVKVHDLQSTNQAWGIYLWAGSWGDPLYLATYQFADRAVVQNCVINNCVNGLVVLTQKNAVLSDMVITSAGGEVVDVENGRNVTFDSIICTSAKAGCFLWQGTNNNIVFNNCEAYSTESIAAAGRVIVGGGGDKTTQYDLANTGTITWNGGVISAAADQYVVVGLQNSFRMIGADLRNTTLQINGPLNTLIAKDNTFAFVSNPSRNIIEINGLCSVNSLALAAGITFTASLSTASPRATIQGNIIKALNALNRVDAVMFYIGDTYDNAYVNIQGNETVQGNGNKIQFSAGDAALTRTRIVQVHDNIIVSGGGLGAPLNAPLSTGAVRLITLSWRNNIRDSGIDTFGAEADTVGATNLNGFATDGCLAGSSNVLWFGGGVGKIWDQVGNAWVAM